jgi:hypothetical protein
MTGFVIGADRCQGTMFPAQLEDCAAEDNPVRVIDIFIDQLDLAKLGFGGVKPKDTGRPAYHPAVMLKIYVYGYLNRVQSSRRLERECQRNVEAMWLTGCGRYSCTFAVPGVPWPKRDHGGRGLFEPWRHPLQVRAKLFKARAHEEVAPVHLRQLDRIAQPFDLAFGQLQGCEPYALQTFRRSVFTIRQVPSALFDKQHFCVIQVRRSEKRIHP